MDGPFGWLAQILGNQNTGGSSAGFGSLGGMTMPQGAPTSSAPGSPMNLLPAAAQGPQMPGILGQFLNRFQPPSPVAATPQPNSVNGSDLNQMGPGMLPQPQAGQQANPNPGANNALMNQAFGLLKGPQMQPTQWMPWMSK